MCEDLFGPGKDKEFFYILDYCQNLGFFGQNPELTEGTLGAPQLDELLAVLDQVRDSALAA